MRLTFLLCFAWTIQAKDCPGLCGDAVEYLDGQPDPNYKKQMIRTVTGTKGKLVNGRIVNGYEVSDRGFITLIRAYDPSDEENYETCGGTLINDLYILTAGHCVCIQNSLSNVQCSYYGELKYDPKEVLKAYIGVNDLNITNLEKHHEVDKYVQRIDKVIKHEGWDGSGLTSPDLALLKLAKKVQFSDNWFSFKSIRPACLPSKNVQVHGEHAYVAGWGRTRNEACFTDNNGPNR